MSLSLVFLLILVVGVIFVVVVAIASVSGRRSGAGRVQSPTAPVNSRAFTGRVVNFQSSTEESGAGEMKSTDQVWDFEIQHRNQAGDVDRSLSVQMVGRSFDGRIRNDEDVAIEMPGGWHQGTTAHVDRIWSESRQVWVMSNQARRSLAPLACIVPIFLIVAAGFVAFAWLVYKAITTINSVSP